MQLKLKLVLFSVIKTFWKMPQNRTQSLGSRCRLLVSADAAPGPREAGEGAPPAGLLWAGSGRAAVQPWAGREAGQGAAPAPTPGV